MTLEPVFASNLIKSGVKTRKELAAEYGMSVSTFYRHLRKQGLTLLHKLLKFLVYPEIYQRFGPPHITPSGKCKQDS